MRINKLNATLWPIRKVCEYVSLGYHIKVEDGQLFVVKVLS